VKQIHPKETFPIDIGFIVLYFYEASGTWFQHHLNRLNRLKSIVLTVVVAFIFSSCELFEYNVYEINRIDYPVEATHEYNIAQLQEREYHDTLHLVFTGDTQRHYNDLEELVSAVNGLPRVDAVFITGDLVEFATTREFQWVSEQLINLNAPFLTVIGNHDCQATALEQYKQVFGPLDYSFTWNKIRFIMHNTNSREFNFNGSVPDLNWMQQSLADEENYEFSLFMCHVAPYHIDFDNSLEPAYTQITRDAKNTLLLVNGHKHTGSLSQPYNDGIWYLNTGSPSKRSFAYVKVYTSTHANKKFDCVFIPF
jgi:Icc protein